MSMLKTLAFPTEQWQTVVVKWSQNATELEMRDGIFLASSLYGGHPQCKIQIDIWALYVEGLEQEGNCIRGALCLVSRSNCLLWITSEHVLCQTACIALDHMRSLSFHPPPKSHVTKDSFSFFHYANHLGVYWLHLHVKRDTAFETDAFASTFLLIRLREGGDYRRRYENITVCS